MASGISKISYRVKAICSAAKVGGGMVHSMEGHYDYTAPAPAPINSRTGHGIHASCTVTSSSSYRRTDLSLETPYRGKQITLTWV